MFSNYFNIRLMAIVLAYVIAGVNAIQDTQLSNSPTTHENDAFVSEYESTTKETIENNCIIPSETKDSTDTSSQQCSTVDSTEQTEQTTPANSQIEIAEETVIQTELSQTTHTESKVTEVDSTNSNNICQTVRPNPTDSTEPTEPTEPQVNGNVVVNENNSQQDKNAQDTNKNKGNNDATSGCTTQPSTSRPPTETDQKDTTDNVDETTPGSIVPADNTLSNNKSSETSSETVNDNVITQKPTKHTCTEHALTLMSTSVNSEFKLYRYVTDIYQCSNCDYTFSETHIASSNISNSLITQEECYVVKLVNQLRKEQGLNELTTDANWQEWADIRAQELSVSYGHVRPNGGMWCHMINQEITYGENVAAGESSGENFYNAFFNSPSHKSLMLEQYATKIAVGIYVDENGITYCAMMVIGF